MKVYLRAARHGFFLVFALVAGFVGVFLVGVPGIGDNPGAIFGGIACFNLTLFFLLLLEALWEARLFRGGRCWEALAEILLTYAAAFLGLSLIEKPGWKVLDFLFLQEQHPLMLAIFGFLVLDAALYWVGKAMMKKLSL